MNGISDFGLRISDCSIGLRRSHCAPSIRNPHSAIRNALTLIELLITITIIAILAAMFLGASSAAMESARAARTKTTINKIHTLLMERWESYRTRRVDIRDAWLDLVAMVPDPKGQGVARADVRLLATRELMKLEMPDRWSDILGAAVANIMPSSSVVDPNAPFVLASNPSIRRAYFRSYKRLNPTATEADILRNQGAECLYLIVMLHTGDGEARTMFSRQDIGDTDGDGALEFLDGWGRPIHFIRWPAGFAPSQIMSFLADVDHDPFDPFGRDKREVKEPSAPTRYRDTYDPDLYDLIEHLDDDFPAFRLVPLVYSAGSDGITDINSSGGFVTGLDPYARDPDPPNYFEFGVPQDDQNNPDGKDNSIDNIHNHLIDSR